MNDDPLRRCQTADSGIEHLRPSLADGAIGALATEGILAVSIGSSVPDSTVGVEAGTVDVEEEACVEELSSPLSDEGAKALTDLLVANKGLIRTIARRFTNQGVEEADLQQEADIAAFLAATKYDPTKGSFGNFAGTHLVGALRRIVDAKRSLIYIPTRHAIAQRAIVRATDEFLATNRREPTEEELASITGLDSGVVKQLLAERHEFVSIHTPLETTDGRGDSTLTVEDTLSDPVTSNEVAVVGVIFTSDELERAFAQLVPRDAEIVMLRHGIGTENEEPMTLDEIGRKFGISRERARQLYDRGYTALKRALGAE